MPLTFVQVAAAAGANLTLGDIQKYFPRMPQKNSALTGRIPMSLFREYENQFRAVMKTWGLRAMYRGSRKSNHGLSRSMTRRLDAESVLLYSCRDKEWRRKSK